MSNSLRDDDVPGTHFWCIRKIWKDHNGWDANLFVKIEDYSLGKHVAFVADVLLATKFKTRDDAEKAAFSLTILSPDLLQKLKVELV
jgi:hypothetical protein